MEKEKEIQDIYPLTPMQEGMLFHSLLDRFSNAYFEQIIFSINGELKIEFIEKGFNLIIKKYDIFRTIFIHEKLKEPKQLVVKERIADVYFEDISDLKENDKVKFLEKFKIKDREKGFDLSKDILIRLSVLKTGEDSFKIILSNHHIIMDGWCLGIIVKDLLSNYKSLKENKPIALEKVYQYKDYIKWLSNQDKEQACLYWKKYLEECNEQTVLPKLSKTGEGESYKQA